MNSEAKSNKKPAIIGGEPAFRERLPIIRPIADRYWKKPEFQDALNEIYTSNNLTGEQKYQLAFEKKFAEISGAKHAVALSNCTSGLMLAIQALGATEKEIILPAFSFSATAHAAAWNNCKIRFVDIDDTLCLDPDAVMEAISPDTAIIMGVHMYGLPCHVEKFDEISRKTGIPVIYDAAHAAGASANGRKLGAFGRAHIYSFSPTKLMTTIEGGMLITDDDELARKIRLDRNYSNPPDYWTERRGLSARLGEPGSALGLMQLNDLETFIKNRESYAAQYRKLLGDIPGVEFQKIPEGYQSTHKDFSVFIDEKKFGLSRDMLVSTLEAENIMTKKYFYPPLHKIAPYKDLRVGDLSVSERKSGTVVSIPIYNYMESETIERVAACVRAAHENSGEINRKLKTQN